MPGTLNTLKKCPPPMTPVPLDHSHLTSLKVFSFTHPSAPVILAIAQGFWSTLFISIAFLFLLCRRLSCASSFRCTSNFRVYSQWYIFGQRWGGRCRHKQLSHRTFKQIYSFSHKFFFRLTFIAKCSRVPRPSHSDSPPLFFLCSFLFLN